MIDAKTLMGGLDENYRPKHTLSEGKTFTVGDIDFEAVRQKNARGQQYWQAKVVKTGATLDQPYDSVPKMVDDLTQLHKAATKGLSGKRAEVQWAYSNGLATYDDVKKAKSESADEEGTPAEVVEETQVDEATLDFKNVVRHVPTGGSVKTKLTDKSLTVTVVSTTSAPPLTTSDISNIERRMKAIADSFFDDAGKLINIKKFDKEPYVFMEGLAGKVVFYYSFTLRVSTKPEAQKLAQLDTALSSYKSK